MSGNSGGALEEAAVSEESQANFARSLVELLKQHRAVLPILPEMFERFIDMESNETCDTQNSGLRRKDEQNVSQKRKVAELLKNNKKELAEKDGRIAQLENELDGKKLELEKLSTEEEEKIASWRKNYCNIEEQLKSSTDGYFKEVDALNQEKEELMERISSLQDDLRSKDMEMALITANKEEQIQEYRARFDRLKEQYEGASSRKDQDLKELNFSNEELTQQIRIKDGQLKECEAKYNELSEAFKVLLADKDEELKRVKISNEELTQQIRAEEEQLKECEAKYNELTEECKVVLVNKDEEFKGVLQARCSELRERFKHIVERKDEELKDMKTRYNQLVEKCNVMLTNKDEELKGMQARHSEFKEKCKVHVGRKDEELKQMKTRLACLSEKQAQKDQRKVEDTTSANRPSDVEKDFAAFFDDDRMDACEKMQEVYGSEKESEVGIFYPRLACMIFETAYEEVKETKEAVLALFKVITKDMIDLAPTKGVEYVSKTKSARLPYDLPFSVIPYGPEMEYPVDVFDALVLSLKETAHKCDLTSLAQGVTLKVREKWLQWLTKETSCRFSFSEYLLTQLSAYINACIRLTWRMVTQVPPMQLEYQSTTLKDIHKNVGHHSGPEMSSRRPTTEGQSSDEELEIACYLWPALLDGGRKLIRVGEVVCKVKDEVTMI